MRRLTFLTTDGKLRFIVVIAGSFLVTCLGIIPGLGLPGGVMLAIGSIVLLPLTHAYPALDQATWPSDSWWPAAILFTLSLFPLLVGAYEVAFRVLSEKPRLTQWCAWFGIVVAWSTIAHVIASAMVAYGV